MIEEISVVIGIIALVAVVGIGIYGFFKLGKEKQLKMIQEWLLLAVVEAEKRLGGGTGKIKLRYVYDIFIDKFKFMALVITFEQFSLMVDDALVIMRDMLSDNEKLKIYVEE